MSGLRPAVSAISKRSRLGFAIEWPVYRRGGTLGQSSVTSHCRREPYNLDQQPCPNV